MESSNEDAEDVVVLDLSQNSDVARPSWRRREREVKPSVKKKRGFGAQPRLVCNESVFCNEVAEGVVVLMLS